MAVALPVKQIFDTWENGRYDLIELSTKFSLVHASPQIFALKCVICSPVIIRRATSFKTAQAVITFVTELCTMKRSEPIILILCDRYPRLIKIVHNKSAFQRL